MNAELYLQTPKFGLKNPLLPAQLKILPEFLQYTFVVNFKIQSRFSWIQKVLDPYLLKHVVPFHDSFHPHPTPPIKICNLIWNTLYIYFFGENLVIFLILWQPPSGNGRGREIKESTKQWKTGKGKWEKAEEDDMAG